MSMTLEAVSPTDVPKRRPDAWTQDVLEKFIADGMSAAIIRSDGSRSSHKMAVVLRHYLRKHPLPIIAMERKGLVYLVLKEVPHELITG